jgi:signal transduction histidine kinase
MASERRPRRNWPLLLGPQAFAGRPEGAVFTAICVVTLLLVSAAELAAPKHATLGAVTFLPIVLASWLLSRRLAILVVAVAIALRVVSAIAGPVDAITTLAEVLTLPLVAVAARQAAVSTIQSHRSERRLTTARRENERTTELERAKSDFMRMASHELRGPVAILRGYLSMLEDGTLGKLPEPAAAVIPVLTAKVNGMSRLVDDMLDTARLEDSRLQLSRSTVDLAVLLRDAIASVRQTLPTSHRLSLEVPNEPVKANVDSERVTMILANLIDNAIKYSPEGGEVLVKLSCSRQRALVEVSDEGLGIAPGDRELLFTRFGRVVTAANRDISGTGLGLYLSRQLALLHGGDIRMRPNNGHGSTFVLELPLAAAPAQEAKTEGRGRRELA